MKPTNLTFRFDDVCINADMVLINTMTEGILQDYPDATVWWGISPLVHYMKDEKCPIAQQRVFPSILNAQSDHRNFFRVDGLGLPYVPNNERIKKASHGLFHVDHRLLTYSQQEMSIIGSCALTASNIFIPPFNKWNGDTESVCDDNNVNLVKFEDGWLSAEHNEFDKEHKLWYLHAREWTANKFFDWLNPSDLDEWGY